MEQLTVQSGSLLARHLNEPYTRVRYWLKKGYKSMEDVRQKKVQEEPVISQIID